MAEPVPGAGATPPPGTPAPDRPPRRGRRGSRGGRNRSRSGPPAGPPTEGDGTPPELPDRLSEGTPSPEAAERALVRRKPQIGDTRPAPRARRRRG
ncbi:MAG: hypothetical protein ACRDZ9_03195, partial [Acidimicrobiales bacterium]